MMKEQKNKINTNQVSENSEIIKSINYTKIKNIFIFILLLIWFLLPVIKQIRPIAEFVYANEYRFMQIVGIIGIYLLAFEIYKKYKNYERHGEKKIFLKEILPLIFFILFMIWTLVSSIFAENKNYAFYGTPYRKEGYITYLIYAGFFACAYSLSSEKLKKILLNIFIVASILNIGLIYLSHNENFAWLIRYKEIVTGVFYNRNHYGYYLLLVTTVSCFLFMKEDKKVLKVLYLIAYIFLAYFLIYNNTLGCYIAFSITLLIYLLYNVIYKKKKIFIIISILIFIILSVFVREDGKNIVYTNINSMTTDISKIFGSIDQNIEKNIEQKYDTENDIKQENKKENSKNSWEKAGSGRAKLWVYGIKLITEKPIFGYGPENLEIEYARFNISQDRPHNLIIQLATTSGIPGMIFYLLGVGLILLRFYKKMKVDKEFSILFFVVITYLISSMFGNSMYYTSPYFFIFLGFI